MKTVRAIYPGSFDPPTFGHIDVIKRSAKIFGGLVVLIAKSSKKQPLFSPEERKQLIKEALGKGSSVKVEIWGGLTVDYMKKAKAHVIVRGLRAVSDFENELQMASINRKLQENVETVAIMASEVYSNISSSNIKELAIHGGDLEKFVPKNVARALVKKIKGE